MYKILLTIVCIAVVLKAQENSLKKISYGKPLFISTIALESIGIAGYAASTGISIGNNKNTANQETSIITSLPFMGTYFLSGGIEKFVTLYQNIKLQNEGIERYRGKSIFQTALYTTSFLTGVATVFTFFAAFEYGDYNATKALMTTNSCLMIGQLIFDIHLYRKNNQLLNDSQFSSSNGYKLKPYLGLSCNKDLQMGFELYF